MRLLGGVVMGALLALVGCAGGFEEQHSPVTYRAVVDSDWSPEQTEAILDGLEFWRGQVGDWVTIEVSIAPCDEQTPDCIAAVSSDNATLREGAERHAQELQEAEVVAGESLRVVGVTTHEAMALDASFAGLGDLFRHEWGHRLGLRHEDGGVMALCVGSAEITARVQADLQARGLL